MPLSSTVVLPDNWAEHHRPVVEGAMPDQCRITQVAEGPKTFDPESGNTSVPIETLYEGKCRIQQLDRVAGATVAGDQTIPTASTLVVVPWDVPNLRSGERGAMVEVLVSSANPQMVGRKLFLNTQTYASLRWECDLFCDDDFARNNPKEA